MKRWVKRAATGLLGLGLLALAGLGAVLGAEAWNAAPTLPPWAPSPPYWLGRTLNALPGNSVETVPWSWLRHAVRSPQRAAAVPPWTAMQVRALTDLSAGGYQGWTDGRDGRLALHGHACTAADPLVSLTLNSGTGPVVVELRYLNLTEVANGVGYTLPVTLIEAPLPPGEYASTATSRCRSGSEANHPLGAVHVLAAPGNSAGLEVWSATSLGHVGRPSELVLFNPGPSTVRLEKAWFAPAAASTGMVYAGAGSLQAVLLWRVGLSEPAGADPSRLSPWDAAYRAPDDARNLRLRPANDLALEVGPNEYALIVVTNASFHQTRPARPLLFFPLIEYVTDAGEQGGLLLRDQLMAGWSDP